LGSHYDSEETAKIIQRCIESFASPNPRNRSRAAQKLGQFKAQIAVPHLIQQLQSDVNTYVRSACAESLGLIGDSRAIFPLMDALSDPCSFVRRAAAIALGQMQAKEAQAALLKTLNDRNFYVRRAAVNALGKLGIPDLGTFLLPLLETSDSRMLRTTITALKRLRTRQAIPKMIALLETYVHDPHQRELTVVKTLVVALGDLRAEAAVPVLTRVARGYVGARSLAVIALGKIGDPQIYPVLIEALSSKSINLRLAALRGLTNLAHVDDPAPVRELLHSPDSRLRRAAILALGELGDKAAIPTLLTIAQEDDSPLVRPAAVEALGSMGESALAHQLLPLARDANAYVRAALAPTLATLDPGSTDVLVALRVLAEDDVEHVAAAAHYALHQCKAHPPKPREAPTSVAPPSEAPAVAEELPWFKRLLRRW